jgi:hypothetical protein
MISSELHKQPIALDRHQHRALKLRDDMNPLRAAAGLNAMFLTAAEFGDACKEYPILFLRAGTNAAGKEQVAPVAVMGLLKGENLFMDSVAGQEPTWDGQYVPALLRAYPFTLGQLQAGQWAVCIDQGWAGWSQTEGRPLFSDAGEPTPYMDEMRGFVERLEAEVERTRVVGERLMELKLLQDKRFDATLPDGSPLSVDGFLAADENRINELSDAEILELHRSGALGVLVTHQVSLGNMRSLLTKRLARLAATGASA